MYYQGFEFTTDSLAYTKIEQSICSYYNLGSADSSNLPDELKQNAPISYRIYGEYGSVSGRLTPYKTSDGYIITVHSADVTKKRNSH